jgi:hypothetical protein
LYHHVFADAPFEYVVDDPCGLYAQVFELIPFE